MTKRFIYYILFAQLLIYSNTLYSQWSTDPRNNLIVGYGLLPEIASDSAGGCYITYEQNLSYPRRLILERLNRYGYKPWGGNRRILGLLPEQSSAKITEDGQGGVIVSYLDQYWGGGIHNPEFKIRLRVQRIDSSGNFLWGPTGVRVSLSETNQGNQAIVSDGSGGCVLVWRDTDTISFQTKIRGQKLDNYGQRVWGDSGIFIVDAYYPPLLAHTKTNYFFGHGRFVKRISGDGIIMWTDSLSFRVIKMVSDNLNGILVGGRSGIANNIFIISQRIDSLGNHQWHNPYITIAESTVINSPIIVLPKLNDYTFAWNGYKDGVSDIRTQIVRSDGSTVFPYGGIQISRTSSRKGIVGVLPSDSMTSVYVWGDNRTIGGIYSQKLDTLGEQKWDTNDVVLNIPMFSDMYVTNDCAGGAIGVGFHQFDFSIRALKVSKNGRLGEVITSALNWQEPFPKYFMLYQNYPNPFNAETNICFDIPTEENIKITLFDLLGRNVKTLTNQYFKPGSHKIILKGGDLSSGVYFYKMQTSKQILVRKLTIIK